MATRQPGPRRGAADSHSRCLSQLAAVGWLDRSGRLQSPAEQHDDNQRAAGSRGWTLGDPCAKAAAVSASRYSGNVRTALDMLCADLDAGSFGARVLMALVGVGARFARFRTPHWHQAMRAR